MKQGKKRALMMALCLEKQSNYFSSYGNEASGGRGRGGSTGHPRPSTVIGRHRPSSAAAIGRY